MASAPDIYRRGGEPSGSVHATTAKVPDRLPGKGLVSRERAHVRHLLGGILRPDVGPAMATLVDAVESMDPGVLDELARLTS